MLTAKSADQDYVEAKDAVRGVAYGCRGCLAPAILHAGQIRPKHFQHHPGSKCAFGAKMSQAHLDAQRALAQALRARGIEVELESWLPDLSGDRRIDVLAYPAGDPDRKIAIEVQQVDITIEAIKARSASYRAKKVAPLWLRLLNFDVFEDVEVLSRTGEIWIERYAALSWERWAHDQSEGLWFCDAGTGAFWRGRFTKAYGWREGSEWHESGGDYNSTPSGYVLVTRWVGLVLNGPYPPVALRLNRGPSRTRSKALTAWFVPADDADDGSQAVRRELRGSVRDTFYLETCDLEQQIADTWYAAETVAAPKGWRTSAASLSVGPSLTRGRCRVARCSILNPAPPAAI